MDMSGQQHVDVRHLRALRLVHRIRRSGHQGALIEKGTPCARQLISPKRLVGHHPGRLRSLAGGAAIGNGGDLALVESQPVAAQLFLVHIGAVDHLDLEAIEIDGKGCGRRRTRQRSGARVQKAKPSIRPAPALLVIAAGKNPRRGGQEARRRIEKVRAPALPAISTWTAPTSGPSLRAGSLSIVVVANMDYEIGPLRRGVSCHRGKRPKLRVVAVLHLRALQPAAGVADDDNPFELARSQRQPPPIDRGASCARRDGRLTGGHGKLHARSLADAHRQRPAIDGRRRTVRPRHNRAHADAIGGKLGPNRGWMVLRPRRKQARGQQRSDHHPAKRPSTLHRPSRHACTAPVRFSHRPGRA